MNHLQPKVELFQKGKLVRSYLLGKQLGSGSFASVYEAAEAGSCGGTPFAIKVIAKDSLNSEFKAKLDREIQIHSSLDHPQIVKLRGHFENEKYIFLELELCARQTLSELLKRRRTLTELETQYYLRQLAKALVYLHERHIVHRDIKLANLFLTDKLTLKLGDFGLAAQIQDSMRHSICGTPNFMAPQIVSRQKEGHSLPADIWSFGVLAYTLMVGVPPFQMVDVQTTYSKIRTGEFNYRRKHISTPAKELIERTLQVDPTLRPAAHQLENFVFFKRNEIPWCMPLCTLICQPSKNFIAQWAIERKERIQACFVEQLQIKNEGRMCVEQDGQIRQEQMYEHVLKQQKGEDQSICQVQMGIQYTKFQQIQPSRQPSISNHTLIHSPSNLISTPQSIQPCPPLSLSTHSPSPFILLSQPYPSLQLFYSSFETQPLPSLYPIILKSHFPQQEQVACSDGLKKEQIQSAMVEPQPQEQQQQEKCYQPQVYVHSTQEESKSQQPAQKENYLSTYKSTHQPHLLSQISTIPLLHLTPQSCPKVIRFVLNNRYGMGYLLQSAHSGTVFNDHTKLVYSPALRAIQYYDKTNVMISQFGVNDPPSHLTKKVGLLLAFRRQLGYHPPGTVTSVPFVRKWISGNPGTVFKFSDGNMQVIFKDSSEIILCGKNKWLRFKNKDGVEWEEQMSESIRVEGEVRKRMKLLKAMLTQEDKDKIK